MKPDSRPRRVIFADDGLLKAYQELKRGRYEEKELAENIDKAIEALRQNRVRQVKVPKAQWPLEYLRKYGITPSSYMTCPAAGA